MIRIRTPPPPFCTHRENEPLPCNISRRTRTSCENAHSQGNGDMELPVQFRCRHICTSALQRWWRMPSCAAWLNLGFTKHGAQQSICRANHNVDVLRRQTMIHRDSKIQEPPPACQGPLPLRLSTLSGFCSKSTHARLPSTVICNDGKSGRAKGRSPWLHHGDCSELDAPSDLLQQIFDPISTTNNAQAQHRVRG